MKTLIPKTYEIWAEGFADNGGSRGAFCLGVSKGVDFKDACKNRAERDAEFNRYFNEERMTWWGCSLYDNQVDAIKSFG